MKKCGGTVKNFTEWFYGIKKAFIPRMVIGSGRPNAIKWQAGRSISGGNGRHSWRGLQGKTDGAAGGDDEEGNNISEIRATEFIRKGEEIT